MEEPYIPKTAPFIEVVDETVAQPVVPVYVPPARKKFPILITLLLILLAFVAAICVYLFIQIKELNTQLTATPTPLPTPVASVDPTSNWQAYTNNDLKFSLKYPNDFIIIQDGWQGIGKDERGFYIVDMEQSEKHFSFIIDYRPRPKTPGGVTITKPEQAIQAIDFSNFEYSSYPAIKYDDISEQGMYILKDKALWHIYMIKPRDVEINSEEINQILSTFKFTDSSPIPTTYTCPKGDWVDCMPTPDVGVRLECTPDYMSWATANCPGFKGAAL